MAGQVSAPRSPDFPAVSCPIPRRRLLPKTVPLLCIFHGPSFPQQKGCCLPASHLSQALAFPHASPPTLLCFYLLLLFFSVSWPMVLLFPRKLSSFKKTTRECCLLQGAVQTNYRCSPSPGPTGPPGGGSFPSPRKFHLPALGFGLLGAEGAEGRVPGNLGVE